MVVVGLGGWLRGFPLGAILRLISVDNQWVVEIEMAHRRDEDFFIKGILGCLHPVPCSPLCCVSYERQFPKYEATPCRY